MTQTIGQRLREIRESRGISLEDIAQRTHIKKAYLRAMEEGDLAALPSQIQMRGFLRLYAAELGMKIDDIQVEGYHLTPSSSKKRDESANESDAESGNDSAVTSEEDQGETPEEPEVDTESQLFTPGEHIEPEFPEEAALLPSAPPVAGSSTEDEPPLGSSSEQIFKEIGDQLTQRRDILSLSLKDVESHIHVRERYLKAIEEGRFNDLPSPVTARGMLANYAEFLNLDVDSILLYFAEGLQKRRLENQAAQPTHREARVLSPNALRLKNFFSLDLLVIALLFITFAGFVIWGVNRILSADLPPIPDDELPEVADILLATGSPTPEMTLSPEESASVEVDENGSPAEETPLFTDLPNDNPINILVIPMQNVWVQVTSDDEQVFEGRLLTSTAYDYSATEKLELLTGNAGALQIYFNDTDIGSVGLIGQVVNLVFDDAGLILPTPTATPTITETPQVTPTPSPSPSPTPTEPIGND